MGVLQRRWNKLSVFCAFRHNQITHTQISESDPHLSEEVFFLSFHILTYLTYLDDIRVGPAFVRLVVLCVLEQYFVHVRRRVLEQFIARVENDQRDFAVAQNRQLVGFLHQTKLALRECHLKTKTKINENKDMIMN